MTRHSGDARTIVLAVASSALAVLALMLAAAMLVYAAVDFGQGDRVPQAPKPLQAIVLVGAITFIGALALLTAFHSIRQLRAGQVSGAGPRRLRLWQGVALLILWIGCAWLAQFLVGRDSGKWLATPFYVLAIATPVYFLVRLALGGLDSRGPSRFWGSLTTGMFLGTSVAVVAEMALALVGLIIAGVYLALHRDLLMAVQGLATQLSRASGTEETLGLVAPLLNHPVTFALGLLFFAGFSPLIEEIAKSLTTWLVYDRLESPSDGFVVGVLSGAGFGLLESLLAAATPDATWGFALLVRGGSSMMHIAAAGLTGWGIAAFRTKHRAARLLGGYALAMIIHSLWNAAVLALAFGGLGLAFNAATPVPVGAVLVGAGGAALAALCLAIPVTLGLFNRSLRAQAPGARPVHQLPDTASVGER